MRARLVLVPANPGIEFELFPEIAPLNCHEP